MLIFVSLSFFSVEKKEKRAIISLNLLIKKHMACKIGKILVYLIIVGLLWILDAFLLGSIDPNVTNGFFAGCWQGTVAVPNFILSLLDTGRIYFAPKHTHSYSVMYFITLIAIVLSLFVVIKHLCRKDKRIR